MQQQNKKQRKAIRVQTLSVVDLEEFQFHAVPGIFGGVRLWQIICDSILSRSHKS